MSCITKFAQYEVRLNNEILQDLISPDKVFKYELSDIHYVDQCEATGMVTGLPGVQLERIKDGVIKFFITVPKQAEIPSVEFGSQTANSESDQIATQTCSEEWTRSGKTQTNSAEFHLVSGTQTDCSGSGVGITQTDRCGVIAGHTQTDNSKLIVSTTQTNSAEWTKSGNTQTNSMEFSLVGVTQTDGSGSLTGFTQTENLGLHSAVTQTDGFDACHSSVVSTQTEFVEYVLAAGTQTDNSFWLCTGMTQTDGTEWLRAEGTQTNNAEWHCVSFTQWDSSDWLSSSACQTDLKEMTVAKCQTAETRIGQTFTSISVETLANLSSQVSSFAQATVEVSDDQCQAVVSQVDVPVQASVQIDNRDTQTDSRSSSEIQSQTDLSMALRSEREIQATVEVMESMSQATVDMAEAAAQSSVEMVESAMQTFTVTVSANCQTDVSMGRESDVEVQVGAETLTNSCQTDQLIEESSSQTELSMSLQADGEVQAVVEFTDSHTECEPLVLSAAATDSSANDVVQNVAAAVADDACQELNTSLLSQSIIDASFTTAVDHHAVADGSSQTDPVTIIIGDASFLVKKLKSSAISPSKIVTTGNEIEIEINPDVASDPTKKALQPPVYDEKENATLNRKSGVAQGLMSPPAAGLIVRGGPGVGPRMRMPVSVGASPIGGQRHQHQQVVMAAHTPDRLLVRHPVATASSSMNVCSPQTAVVRGPQPLVGGAMSCPFCALAFIDSPALYEHLSLQHTVDQKTKWRQPRGREGKTIVPQQWVEPPAATQGGGQQALSPINVSAAGVRYRSPTLARPITVAPVSTSTANVIHQEAGLFEDPVELEQTGAAKKPRGRQSVKSDSRAPLGGDGDSSAPAAKRLRTVANDDSDDDSPLRRPSVNKKTTAASDSPPLTPVTRRAGRSPRAAKK